MNKELFSYLRFEDKVRGSVEQAKDEMKKYLAFFEGCANVLDFGCGRGEFLELLREAGIGCHGVDSDPEMVRLCREKGLTCLEGDGLSHLAEIAEGSLDGLIASHVVEHLARENFFRLVELASTRLKSGGVFIAETLNPQCVFTQGVFHLDPTHQQFVHPQLFQHLLTELGFQDIKLITRQYLPEELLKFENFVPPSNPPSPLEAAYLETVRKLDILSKLLLRDFLYAVSARRS
ncbi:MAG: class I SAM-dependent methyltransferase [bacterium]